MRSRRSVEKVCPKFTPDSDVLEHLPPRSSRPVSNISVHVQHCGGHKSMIQSPRRAPDAWLDDGRLKATLGSLSRLSQPHSRRTKPISSSVTPHDAELHAFASPL